MTLRTAKSTVFKGTSFPLFDTIRGPGSTVARNWGCSLAISGRLTGFLYYRLNHVSRTDDGQLDGSKQATADKDCCDGFPGDGTVEKLGRTSDGKYRYRYTEGPRDKAFMEQKDREYLTALKDSEDPAMQARFEEEFATLDLSLEHHRNLKREFEPFTRAYREAAGGGGEGGGPQPPAADAASTLPEQSDASSLFRRP